MKEVIKIQPGKVLIFETTTCREDPEQLRKKLKKQVKEGVVLLEPDVKLIGCFRKEKKK